MLAREFEAQAEADVSSIRAELESAQRIVAQQQEQLANASAEADDAAPSSPMATSSSPTMPLRPSPITKSLHITVLETRAALVAAHQRLEKEDKLVSTMNILPLSSRAPIPSSTHLLGPTLPPWTSSTRRSPALS